MISNRSAMSTMQPKRMRSPFSGAGAIILCFFLASTGRSQEQNDLSGSDVKGLVSSVARHMPVGPFDDRFPPPPHERIRLEKSVRVPMRDGVRLSTDLYFPDGVAAPFPVVLIRLPYDKNRYSTQESLPSFFAGHGYAVAVQDMRGRYESEGSYLVSAADREDGYDMVEWLSSQPWSTGKIGTYGCSYLGENQVQLAAMRHPNHLAAVPLAAGGAYVGTHRPFGVLDGGVFELATGLGWFSRNGMKVFARPGADLSDAEFSRVIESFQVKPNLPQIDYQKAFWTLPANKILTGAGMRVPTDFEDFVSHGPADPYWKKLNFVHDEDRFDVPAIHVSSWFDTSDETLRLFNLFRDNAESDRGRRNQFAIISPTAHCRSESQTSPAVIGERFFGDVSLPYYHIYLDWFDYWLKDERNDVTAMPKVQYFLMGKNEWRSAPAWPIPDTSFVQWFLHSDGSANTRLGTGSLDTKTPREEAPDHFTYDPRYPVPSHGGPICCISSDDAPAGAYDQSAVEMRHDVLVYSSQPLDEGLAVVGPLEVVLYVSSSAKDTDFTVKLVDVYPDGRAFNVQESILRARYRDGYDKEVWMRPGETYRIQINLHATANFFGAGHRVRLEVSSSNFPRFVRNLNTGGNNFDEVTSVVARNTVHHSEASPSHVVLPVIDTR